MGFEIHSDLFIEEAMDLLRDIESPLMELEAHPERTELIDTVFRAMHTIKGSAGMIGLEEVARFTHDIETAFMEVKPCLGFRLCSVDGEHFRNTVKTQV
ncbi:MAG: Hpt domain-containing protein [Spirochaetota bacterium]